VRVATGKLLGDDSVAELLFQEGDNGFRSHQGLSTLAEGVTNSAPARDGGRWSGV
jgi:hypothetical protein